MLQGFPEAVIAKQRPIFATTLTEGAYLLCDRQRRAGVKICLQASRTASYSELVRASARQYLQLLRT